VTTRSITLDGERSGRHGTAVPRGQTAEAAHDVLQGRFGQLFPDCQACAVSDDAIDVLVELMKDKADSPQSNNNPSIPAGYTYLGQFIDHDITFDPTSRLDQGNDLKALVNFRTPRYDLDSVYGSGRAAQPFLYDWKESEPAGTKLLVGRNAFDTTDDLPRNQQGRALIGDARNDENVIIAQLHLLFIRFHNAVVDHLRRQRTVRKRDLFDVAQRLVRWHYQWIVVHEFLPKVVGREMAKSVLADEDPNREPVVRRRYFRWEGDPFIPVEFSGAAYRFGHSMVRNQYGLKRREQGEPAPKGRDLFPDLAGFKWLSRNLVISWDRFFELSDAELPPQPSFRINTTIAGPLSNLPDRGGELPRRNLERGRALGLPSGQDVASAMKQAALPEEALMLDEQIRPDIRSELLAATPLWYYILCEAAHAARGCHLGPVGGRIVAEVLVGLLEGDPSSYLSQEPGWRPSELKPKDEEDEGDFTMADLVEFTQRLE
jgi:hypothetical protein